MDPLSGLRTVIGDTAVGWEAEAGDPRPDPLGEGRGEPDLFAASPGAGVLELVDHDRPLPEQGPEELAATLERWRERMRAHAEARYVHLWADAHRTHVHALPFVPAQVARERERFTAYRERTQGRNLQADLLQAEVRNRERVVAVGPAVVALCPFASHAPFHVQLLPRAERERFEDDGPTGADTLHEVVRAMTALDLPGLRVWVRTAPPGSTAFSWRIEVVPADGPAAGLEAGAGVHESSVAPERAAGELRAALR